MDEKCEPKIEVAGDGMSATLILPGGYDRSELKPMMCMALLKQADIDTQAINQEVLSVYIAQAMDAAPGRFEGVIAHATPVEHGSDAHIEWLIEEPSTAPTNATTKDAETEPESAAAQASDDEAVCFYSHSIFTVVREGDVLGEIHPEILGADGRDVHGKPIPARSGKAIQLKHDESIAIKDGKTIIAQRDGILIHDETTARVSDTLEVESNVDFSTGNIDFPGNVLAHQSVKDGFTIKASEDIEVRGLIEAANLIAGKDLRVMGGFAGREQGNAEVAGDLHGKYLDAITAHIAGDLCIEREVINSDCTVLGKIICPRGSLIGGCTRVSGTVELSELGATANPVTELHVGVLPVLDPLIKQLSEFIQRCTDERTELFEEQELITAHSGARLAPTHQTKLNHIMLKMGQLQLQLDRAEPSLKQARERAESIRKIDVQVDRLVYPNVVLVCGEHRYRITNEIKGPVRITANKRGQLEIQQGDGPATLLSEEAELKAAA
jgi:hypothetical protein